MTRYLGLDYGDKRIGLAISDPLGSMAMPRNFIPNSKAAIQHIKRIVKEDDIAAIVLGLPRQMDGQDSKTTQKVRVWGEKLAAQCQVKVIFQDERLSTQAVERELIGHDLSRKKRKTVIDSQAAAFILQGFLDKENAAKL